MLEIMLASVFKKLNEPEIEVDPEVFEKLLVSDEASGAQFGYSVAVSTDGTTVIVGANGDDDKGDNSGTAYVFIKQSNGSYLETQKLVASDGATNEYFGTSVDVSSDGTTVLVGAYGDGDKGSYSGSVYVFTKQANGNYLQTQKLVANDGVAVDWFGISVAVSGDGSIIVVGARYDDDKGTDSGSAYIFTKQVNSSYVQTQKLTASDGAAFDNFGFSVTISDDGSTIVVGAYGDDDGGNNAGSAYVFTKQANESYLQTQKLAALDGVADDYFGCSVAISEDGSVIVVGAYRDDDKGINSGSVYIFTKQANGSYLQVQKLLATDGTANDSFGYGVATSEDGSTIIIGAYGDDDKGIDSGSAYVFTKQANGIYLQTQKLVASDETAGDSFGWSVAVSNTSVVIGAYNHLGKGTIYVY